MNQINDIYNIDFEGKKINTKTLYEMNFKI